ncbi:hypothetical protein [Falsiruegeria mediterranea]
MPELERDDLFDAFRHRRHYATTGCRPYIDVRIGGLENGQRRLHSGDITPVETAHIGDILSCSNDMFKLDIDISAQAGIERIEVKDGTDVLAHVQPEMERRMAGNRVRVQCEGAEYRGRSRRVDWDVSLKLHGATPLKTQAVNFWNADCEIKVEDDAVNWGYVTTGGAHAADVWLNDASMGKLSFTSNITNFDIKLSELDANDLVEDCGGLGKAVRVTRLPDEPLPATLTHQVSVPLSSGQERCLFIRVVFEDEHIAWTSPIYVTRCDCRTQHGKQRVARNPVCSHRIQSASVCRCSKYSALDAQIA